MLFNILYKFLELFFLGMGIFFEFGATVSLYVILTQSFGLGFRTLIMTFTFGLLFIYSGINLVKKSPHRFQSCLLVLSTTFLVTTLHRLFFITGKRFEQADYSNLVLFGVPFLLTLLTSKLSNYEN